MSFTLPPRAMVWRARRSVPLLTACLAGALCLGCEKEQDLYQPAAPRRQTPEKAPSSSARHAYQLTAPSEVRFRSRAREGSQRGEFPVLRGELSLDLGQLERSQGRIEVDVAALRMHSLDGGLSAADSQRAEEARNWLNVGSSRPEGERERLRWARFELKRVENASAASAHDGKKLRPPETTGSSSNADSSPEGKADASPKAAPTIVETRRVTLTAIGDLELNGHRVQRAVQLELDFLYDTPASPEAKPVRVLVRTRRPLVVGLRAHDVKPRDAKGRVVSSKLRWLGLKVGRDVQIDVLLDVVPKGSG